MTGHIRIDHVSSVKRRGRRRPRVFRHWAIALTTVAVALAVGVPVASAADSVGSLASGDSVFWDGAYVSSARVDDPSLCDVEGPCFRYQLTVANADAKVLRVALRTPDDSNGWQVVLIDPSGNPAASGTTYTLHGVAEDFDVELWVHKPLPGKWTVEVVPQNVQNGTFRMRAGLDPPITWPGTSPTLAPAVTVTPASVHRVKRCRVRHAGHRRIRHCVRRRVYAKRMVQTAPGSTARAGVRDTPPDLAADAPWHLTFDQPLPMVVVEGGNFTALLGAHNSTTTVAGQPTYSCLPEEMIEQGATRCLRFTSGFASAGPGKFEVYGSSPGPVAPTGGDLYQNVYRSDGSFYSRQAGSFEFHTYHGHYHVLGIAQFEMFRVSGEHALSPTGTVLKEGFCLGDIKVLNWSSFAQSEIDPSSIDNCEPSLQPDGTWRFYEGIDSGWEDSYKWQTSGQFGEFSGNPDGFYVLRVTVNPLGKLLESDAGHDTNNVAYTYFEVTGNAIRQIERGHGTDPWDPRKQVENPVFGE